jgi:hypothetical protein
MITPAGVRMASATQSMVLCVTWIGSTSNAPMLILSPGTISRSTASAKWPLSVSFFRSNASVNRVPYTGTFNSGRM